MSGDLRSCPFCGSDDIDADHGAWGVICNQCDATGPGRCHNDASYWNTRAPDPAVAVLEAEVARLREALDGLLSAAVRREYDWAGFEWEVRLAIRKANWPFSPAPGEKEAG